jgi:hypothetical protein
MIILLLQVYDELFVFFLASACLSYELLVLIILGVSLLIGIGYFVWYDFSI